MVSCPDTLPASPTERDLLIAFYCAADGQNWTANQNWLTNMTLGTWAGVRTNTQGEVTSIDLSDNNLSGTIPTELGDLTSLQTLSLYSNSLSGTIPTELGDLTSLQTLSLYSNSLSGTIPTELGDLTSLQTLSLYSNSLSGTIPTELGDLTSLQTLSLYSNSLSGTIPTELGDLTSLQTLSLYSNSLSGTIPTELGDLTSLQTLSLYSNSLSGTIPTELGDLTSLQTLSLYSNSLSGTIPTELGDLTSLQTLSLYSNSLSGTIPTELGDLTSLQQLLLNQNQLSGTIPDFSTLRSLRTLDLSHNVSLSGSLGQNLTDLPFLSELSVKCTRISTPTDADFQEWLNSISFTGAAGSDCSLGAVKTTTGLKQQQEPPGQVRGVSVTPRVERLRVSWNAVTNANGYKVQWKSGAQNYNETDRQGTTRHTTHAITGLTGGTQYTVRVIAVRVNAADGPPSAEVTGTPRAAAPGQVTGVILLTGMERLSVSWNGATNADGYKVQWKSGAQDYDSSRQAAVTGIGYIITGLAAGTQYTVRVIATRVNADDGPPSPEVTETTRAAPPAPGRVTGVSVTPGAGQLSVSWSPANNADGYRVQWRSGAQSYNETDRQAVVMTGTTHTITGLTAGTQYTIRVISTRVNADDGPPSAEVTGIPRAAAPGRVSGVSVTPGAGQLSVSWNAATNADGYRVQWRSGAQDYDSSRQAAVTGTTHTITGLAAGTQYTVRVISTRVNADDGTPSAEVTGTPRAEPPGRVSGVSVIFFRAGQLSVSWNAATNADGYKVQWKSGAQSYDSSRQAVVTGTIHTITGLAAGTPYTIRVISTRVNADDGTPSPEVTGTPKAAAPGRVSGVSVTPGVEQLGVSWDAATNADGYRVQWRSGAQSYNETDRQAVVTGTTHTITGLAAGTQYTVRVISTRVNADDGTPSAEVTGTPRAAAAGQVTGVSVTPGGEQLSVSWNVATNANGYKVQWRSGGQSYDSSRQAVVTGTIHTITGLAAGTRYTIRVISTRVNADDGPPSAEVTGTPRAAVPGQVTGVSVTAPDAGEQLRVSWNAATNADGYKVQWKSGGQSYDSSRQVTVTATGFTRVGLTAGTQYTIRVISTRVNADDGPPSAEVTGIPKAIPAWQVTGVSVTPGAGQLSVSWSPANNADGYRVQWKSGGQSYDSSRQAAVTGTTHTITGLAAGTQYTIRVISTRVNAVDGTPSAEVTGTPRAAAPGRVSGVSVTPGVEQLGVSWDPAADADGYRVQWRSGAQDYDSSRQAAVTGTGYTITGLTAGTQYTVRVISTRVNADDGTPSAEVTGTPRAAAAGRVTGVSVTPGVEQLGVSWDPAADAEGYKVQWKSGAQSYSETDRKTVVTGTDYTITGLTAGTQYTVRVTATRVNADDGTPSAEVTGTPRAEPPGRVTGVSVTPGVEQLGVSWSPAADADGYRVQWKSGGQSYDSSRQAAVTGTTHTITGLTAGTQYTIRVISTRVNADDGPPSAEVTGTPRAAAPGRVTGVSVTPGVEQLGVSWSPEADADGYRVQWRSGAQDYDSSRQAVVTGTGYTITGLAAGTPYTVRVISTRVNADDGTPSAEVTGTPRAAVPGQVTGVSVTPGVEQLGVSWSPEADADGYRVQWRSGAQDYDSSRQAVVTGTGYTITGLAAGTQYTVRVIVTRVNADDGTPSAEVTGTPRAAAAGQVSGVSVTPGVEQLGVSWDPAADADGYRVQWRSGAQDYDSSRQAAVTGTTHTITGLTAGTQYTIRVISTRVNADDGPPSAEVTGTPRAAAPGRVTGVSVTPGVEQLGVSWSPEADADGYRVQWRSGAQSYDSSRQAVVTGTGYTITGLAAGTPYTVRVTATRVNADDGTPSAEVTGTPRAAVPGQVTGVSVTPGVEQLGVSWDPAADADGYKVQWRSGAQDYDSSRQAVVTGTGYTITGLAAGTQYTVRVIVTRVNADDGTPSAEVTGTPRAEPPGRVTGVSVTPGVEQLGVSWSPAADADGYRVQWRSGAQDYDSSRQAVVTATGYTITGLTAGTQYTIRVISTRVNADDGTPSAEVTGTPRAAAAGQVTGVSVTPGVEQLGVSWSPEADAEGYKVQWRSGAQSYDSSRQAVVTGTGYTITGLTAGTQYTIRVTATRVNADDGTPSAEVTGTPRAAVPGQVTGVSVTPGVEQLGVSWSPEADAEGYKVQWRSGAQSYNETDRQAVVTATGYTITGLAAGTQYTVRVIVTRVNADDGTPSAEVTGTPRAAAAGQVSGVSVIPGVEQLGVSWDPAADADGYRVQWRSGAQDYDSSRQAVVTATTHTITGLTAGTQYTIRVTATRVNADDGTPSAEVTGTPRAAAAGQVTGVSVTPGVEQLGVSWSPEADAEGYKVQWKSGGQSYNETDRQAVVTATGYTITGLAAGTQYTVRVIVTRVNADDGTPSAEVTGTPRAAAAGQVSGVSVIPGVEQLGVSWSPEADAEGYKVQWRSGAQSYNETDRQAVVTATGYTITGLAAGTQYTVRVIVTRVNADDGTPSAEVTGIPRAAAPGRVTGVSVTPGAGQLSVSWSPANNADGYRVQWRSGAQSYDSSRQAVVTATGYTITGLAAGTQYTVRVTATRVNADDGTPSAEVTGTPRAAAAGQVTGVSVIPGVEQLGVSWDPAADAEGYKVQWKSGAQDYDSSRQVTVTDTGHIIMGLAAGTQYTVRVIVIKVNADDYSPSDEVTGTPEAFDQDTPDDFLTDASGGGCAIASASQYTLNDMSESALFNLFLLMPILFLALRRMPIAFSVE